jgi:hypothetical protein
MADPIQVVITKSDLSVQEPNTTIIDSIELVNALVVEPADAWQSIAAAFSSVNTDNVRITADGKMIILDEQFTALVKQFLAEPGGAAGGCIPFLCANYKCGV